MRGKKEMRIQSNDIGDMKSFRRQWMLFWMFCVLAVVALLTVIASPMFGDISLGVFPIRTEHEVPAGQTKTAGITVENTTEESVNLRVTVADWYLTRDGMPMFVKRGKSPAFSMSDWMVVNPSEFVLPPHGKQVIRYTFSVPADAAPGGYRTAVLIENVPIIAPGEQVRITYLNARIAAIIYNRVGQTAPQASITDQRVILDPKESGRVGVQISLKNSGVAHFRYKGETKIIDHQGKVVETLAILDSVILPQAERDIFVPMKSVLPSDGFSIVSTLDIGLKELLAAETQVDPPSRGQ
jgi:P pilus assembly chaperone PapD